MKNLINKRMKFPCGAAIIFAILAGAQTSASAENKEPSMTRAEMHHLLVSDHYLKIRFENKAAMKALESYSIKCGHGQEMPLGLAVAAMHRIANNAIKNWETVYSVLERGGDIRVVREAFAKDSGRSMGGTVEFEVNRWGDIIPGRMSIMGIASFCFEPYGPIDNPAPRTEKPKTPQQPKQQQPTPIKEQPASKKAESSPTEESSFAPKYQMKSHSDIVRWMTGHQVSAAYARDVAQHIKYRPTSECAQVATDAMDGDREALSILNQEWDNPICRWRR